MDYLDFLMSEYKWCLDQYSRLGYAHYMGRAMVLETKINEYKQASYLVAA